MIDSIFAILFNENLNTTITKLWIILPEVLKLDLFTDSIIDSDLITAGIFERIPWRCSLRLINEFASEKFK